jgi:hypothetical protein
MGEYRLSIYWKTQIGLNLSYEYGQIVIRIPFIDINIGISKYAKGVLIFGKEL